MYKRYLEPLSEINPTKYITKKLKFNEHTKTKETTNYPPETGNALEILICEDEEGAESHGEEEIQSQNEYGNDGAKGNNRIESDDLCDNELSDDSKTRNRDIDVQENISVAEGMNFSEDDINGDDFFSSINNNFIHPNLNCKTADAILMILEFFLRHRLTWVALESLLQLFHSILGDQSQLPKTKYFFKKVFGDNQQAVFHFYCQNCTLYIDSLDNLKIQNAMGETETRNMSCSNCQHKFSLQKMNDGHFFIQLPLRHQILKKIAKNPEILDYNTTANTDNSIKDIFDGRLYQSLKEKIQIHGGKLITLTMNTDGVRIFKSKKKASLWPIQMYINEISPTQRFKLENIILNGIWFGKDPDFALYMKPLTDELNQLDQSKIRVTVNNICYDITVRGFLMTTDSVARCKVLKMKQYNGKFGCTYCLHPGNIVDGSKVSKYHLAPNEYCPRTHFSTLELMKKFLATGKGSSGITGVSPLLGLKDYDLIRGTPIDYMHCVLLGIVCLLLSLWFDSSNHFHNYYITPRRREAVNKNIKCLQPLKGFHRPRTIDERMYWKANECRNWLLFYAIPCLKDTLKDVYLQHFVLLSEAIFIFLKTNISTGEFKKASDNINEFVKKFQSLYGHENMMYNVHLLSHLAQCVKDCGPLWAYSNFSFESNNGSLGKHVNGTTDVEYQILSKYFYNNVLENLKHNDENAGNYVERSVTVDSNPVKKLA